MGGMWNWGPRHYALYKAILMSGLYLPKLGAEGVYICPVCGKLVRAGCLPVEDHVSSHESAELDMWWVVRAFA